MTVTNHSAIQDIEQEITDEFDLLENDMKYEYLIDIGKQLPVLDEQYKTDDNLVKGCQSKVWLHCYAENGKVIYEADSNTVITKGIIGLLTRVLSNQTPEDILSAQLAFIDKIGLRSLLSSQRSNGLTAMVEKMKRYAHHVQTEKNK